eukprot:1559790-Prymnesium_polylepis.1
MAGSATAEGYGAVCVAVGTHDRLAPLMAASATAGGCGAACVAAGTHDRSFGGADGWECCSWWLWRDVCGRGPAQSFGAADGPVILGYTGI